MVVDPSNASKVHVSLVGLTLPVPLLTEPVDLLNFFFVRLPVASVPTISAFGTVSGKLYIGAVPSTMLPLESMKTGFLVPPIGPVIGLATPLQVDPILCVNHF